MDGEGWKESCDKAMKELGITDPDDPSYVDKAAQLFHKWWEDKPESEKVRHFHEANFNAAKMWVMMPMMHESIHALLQAMIVQAWTAFEVLSEHVWREATKLRPLLLSAMSKKEENAVGFRSRKKIRESYKMTFKKDNSTILKSLAPTAIDALAVVRCILVHSAGKIDDWFLRDGVGVPEVAHLMMLPIGTAVEFTASFTRSLIDDVTPGGYDLIQTVDNWLLLHS